MKSLAKIFCYILAVLLLAAIVSPPLYWTAHAVGRHGIAVFLSSFPFHRYFTRTAQFFAIVLLWPAIRWLNIRGMSDFGLHRNPAPAGDAVAGGLIAIVPVGILLAVCLGTGLSRIAAHHDALKLLIIALTAVAVAPLEEVIFRGLLLGLASRSFGRLAGAVVISLIFAGIHFIKPATPPVEPPVTWTSGFEQIPAAFSGAPEAEVSAWAFVSLFVAGMILAIARFRTRSLWLPIGMHAGWIFGQQTIQWLTRSRIHPEDAFLPWIGPNVISGSVPTGIIPLAAVLVSGVLMYLYLWYALPKGRGTF